MLFATARHEAINGIPWDEHLVRNTIREIASDAISTFHPKTLFPAHPLDEPSHSHLGSGHYFGAGGVLWSLDRLSRNEVIDLDATWLADSLLSLLPRFANEAEARGPLSGVTSLLFGDLPIVLQLFRLTGDTIWRHAAIQRIKESVADPVRELMWGTSGILLLTEQIRDAEFQAAISNFEAQNLQKLFEAWNHEQDGLHLWCEELYGSRHVVLGTVHGFFGQVLPLLRRIEELPRQQQAVVLERTRDVFCQTAVRDSRLANWPVMLDERRDFLVHYCHGAPGIVNSACSFPKDRDIEFEEILLDGGELIWRAGPLRKGSNLCHGTAGNGFAFLKLLTRTEDQIWLDRARAFAMHSIAQYQKAREELGYARFSLWTGDAGLAVFLMQCIAGESKMPVIDDF